MNKELLKEVEMLRKEFQGHEQGSCGKINWCLDYIIITNDFNNSKVEIILNYAEEELIHANLDISHPRTEIVTKNILGVEVSAAVGLDFETAQLYYEIKISGLKIKRPIMFFNFSFESDLDRLEWDINEDDELKEQIKGKLTAGATAETFIKAADELGYHIMKEELLQRIPSEIKGSDTSGTFIFVTQILVS